MTELHEELLVIANKLEALSARGREPNIQEPLIQLERAGEEARKAWCGSWMGYLANVYYYDLRTPPQGVHFRGRWGSDQVQQDWVEFNSDKVIQEIVRRAGEPDFTPVDIFNKEASNAFTTSRLALLSILDVAIQNIESSFLSALRDTVSELSLITKIEFVQRWMSDPSQSRLILDNRAMLEKPQTPPHFWLFGEIHEVRQTLSMVDELGTLSEQAALHVQRQARQQQITPNTQSQGTKIFIGHGHSHIWRALKDFLVDDLGLEVDEFERVPTAGKSITSRLEEMLDSAAIAFLVMTGEDEQLSGEFRARENVVHEAGLFQGRLGFTRAIVLLEEDCPKFSNNAGLVHINFPKDNIRAAFHEIRGVLKREEIING